MTGFADNPGTDVEPTCSHSNAVSERASWICIQTPYFPYQSLCNDDWPHRRHDVQRHWWLQPGQHPCVENVFHTLPQPSKNGSGVPPQSQHQRLESEGCQLQSGHRIPRSVSSSSGAITLAVIASDARPSFKNRSGGTNGSYSRAMNPSWLAAAKLWRISLFYKHARVTMFIGSAAPDRPRAHRAMWFHTSALPPRARLLVPLRCTVCLQWPPAHPASSSRRTLCSTPARRGDAGTSCVAAVLAHR
jgi:hypothetical protein